MKLMRERIWRTGEVGPSFEAGRTFASSHAVAFTCRLQMAALVSVTTEAHRNLDSLGLRVMAQFSPLSGFTPTTAP